MGGAPLLHVGELDDDDDDGGGDAATADANGRRKNTYVSVHRGSVTSIARGEVPFKIET